MNLNLEGLYFKNLNFARTERERERERERQITSLQSLKKILLLESPFCIKSKKRGHSLIRKSRLIGESRL